MRFFIDKTGNAKFLTCSHDKECGHQKTTLKRHLLRNVRIAINKNVLAAELTGKITDLQRRAIRKLYKEYRCFDFVAMINGKYVNEIKGF